MFLWCQKHGILLLCPLMWWWSINQKRVFKQTAGLVVVTFVAVQYLTWFQYHRMIPIVYPTCWKIAIKIAFFAPSWCWWSRWSGLDLFPEKKAWNCGDVGWLTQDEWIPMLLSLLTGAERHAQRFPRLCSEKPWVHVMVGVPKPCDFTSIFAPLSNP